MKNIFLLLLLIQTITFSCSNTDRNENEYVQQIIDSADTYYDSLKYEKALKLYIEALELKPDDAERLSDVANVKYILEEYDEALNYINLSQSIDKTDNYTYYLKSQILFKLGKKDSCLKQLDILLEMDSVEFYLAGNENGKIIPKVITKYDIIIEKLHTLYEFKDYTRLIQTADYFTKNFADSLQFLVYKINGYLRTNSVDKACYTVKDYPDREKILATQIQGLYNDSFYTPGIVLIDSLLKLNKYNSEYYLFQAEFYKMVKDTIAALNCYDKGIMLNNKNEVAFYNRGNIYYDRGDFKNAIKDYSKAINLNPGYYQAYTNRGLLYESIGRNDLAEKDFKTAASYGEELAMKKLKNQNIN